MTVQFRDKISSQTIWCYFHYHHWKTEQWSWTKLNEAVTQWSKPRSLSWNLNTTQSRIKYNKQRNFCVTSIKTQTKKKKVKILRPYLKWALRKMCPNTEFFLVRIQSECGKIRANKNSVFGHFSRSGGREKQYHFCWRIEVFKVFNEFFVSVAENLEIFPNFSSIKDLNNIDDRKLQFDTHPSIIAIKQKC